MLDFDIGIVHIIKFSPMKTIIFVSVSLLFICCNNPKVVEKKTYVISVEKKKAFLATVKDSLPPPPPPQFNFYGANHLIISKNQELYYYQNSDFSIDNGCLGQIEPIPRFMNLQCENLIKLSNVGLYDFLDDNVIANYRNRKHLIISSQSDTIRNQKFLAYFKKIHIPYYVFRKTTMEEDTVIHYKMERIAYFAENIKWDMKRIYFSDKML